MRILAYPPVSALELTTTLDQSALALALLGSAAILVVVVLGFSAVQRRRVREESLALVQLGKLNDSYGTAVSKLAPIRNRYSVAATTKSKFDRFDLGSYLTQCVIENEGWFEQEIGRRVSALDHFDQYHGHFESLAAQLLGSSAHPRVSTERFQKIEKKLYRRMKLRYPEARASITVTLRYTSPKGRNSYVRRAHWDFDELRNGIRHAQLTRERQSTVQAQRARERALMTPALRADVLRRDGYRCKMCGASSGDGVRLHVDHIVPVSHNGPTRLYNLQTLCDTCNLGKGNRFVG